MYFGCAQPLSWAKSHVSPTITDLPVPLAPMMHVKASSPHTLTRLPYDLKSAVHQGQTKLYIDSLDL